MVAAVLIMPVAILLKDTHELATVFVLFFTMLLELIGLIYVILSIFKSRKARAKEHD